jgi:multidrug efflux pump subunit AcrA (membrane-fusion protein)
VAAAQHNVTAQEKLVKQLRQERDYAAVVAPFDGVITQHNVDVGSLVQGNATSGTFMFEIMQENVIRVSAYVPQDAAFGIAAGIAAVRDADRTGPSRKPCPLGAKASFGASCPPRRVAAKGGELNPQPCSASATRTALDAPFATFETTPGWRWGRGRRCRSARGWSSAASGR